MFLIAYWKRRYGRSGNFGSCSLSYFYFFAWLVKFPSASCTWSCMVRKKKKFLFHLEYFVGRICYCRRSQGGLVGYICTSKSFWDLNYSISSLHRSWYKSDCFEIRAVINALALTDLIIENEKYHEPLYSNFHASHVPEKWKILTLKKII